MPLDREILESWGTKIVEQQTILDIINIICFIFMVITVCYFSNTRFKNCLTENIYIALDKRTEFVWVFNLMEKGWIYSKEAFHLIWMYIFQTLDVWLPWNTIDCHYQKQANRQNISFVFCGISLICKYTEI